MNGMPADAGKGWLIALTDAGGRSGSGVVEVQCLAGMRCGVVVAVDVGYGFTKAVAAGGRRVVFPSTIAPPSAGGRLADALGGSADGHTVSVLGGPQYRVGGTGQRTWDADATDRTGYDALCLSAACLVGATGEVDLALGLPLAAWLRKDQRRGLRDQFLGTSAWVSVDGAEAVHLVIGAVRVFPQGAGVFVAAATEDPSLASRPVGLIDIGYRTTDYLLMRRQTSGLAPDEAVCGSFDAGAGCVYERVRQTLTERSGVLVPDAAVEDALAHYDGRLFLRGAETDLRPLIDAEAQALAVEIGEQMRRLWSDRLDLLGAVLLAGGGGEAFGPYLTGLHPLVRPASDALFANAAGFLGMAQGVIGVPA